MLSLYKEMFLCTKKVKIRFGLDLNWSRSKMGHFDGITSL